MPYVKLSKKAMRYKCPRRLHISLKVSHAASFGVPRKDFGEIKRPSRQIRRGKTLCARYERKLSQTRAQKENLAWFDECSLWRRQIPAHPAMTREKKCKRGV